MNKSKKRLLSCLLLTIGGLNLGGVSNAQPKDSTNTFNISSEKSKRSSETSGIFNLRNGIDLGLIFTIIFGGKELLDKNNDLQKKYESLEKKNKSFEEENESLKEENVNVKFDLDINKAHSEIKYGELQGKYDSLKNSCNSFWNENKQLEEKLLLLKKRYLMEMDNFKLLNEFQELFRRYFPCGVKFDNYHFEELCEENFGDYDIVNFDAAAAAFGKGVDYMSAYVIQKGSVGKEGNVFDNVQSDKLVTIYYPLNGSTNYWSERHRYYKLGPHRAAGFCPREEKFKVNLCASEKEKEEMKKKIEEKFKVVIIKFEELLKCDNKQFKDFYIICEAYRDVDPKSERDDVYYKFLLVKKNEKN